MRIAIIGFSGSGKSTLAKVLGQFYHIPVCHLDALYHLPNWEERSDEEFDELLKDFMKNNENWIIEGSYLKHVPARFEEADIVIGLIYNRFVCLKGVIKRYYKYKGKTRPDMGLGCEEKLDYTFIKWVFFKGHTKKRKKKLLHVIDCAKEGYAFKNRRQLQRYLKNKGVVKE